MEHPVVKLKSSLFSQDHLAAIGSVAVESANLEELLDIILDGLLGLNTKQRDIVFEGAMMQRKLELVKELGCQKLKSQRRKLELTKIIGDLNHANQERSTAIHGTWQIADKTALKAKVYGTGKAVATKKGRRNKPDSTIEADKLIGVAERISEGAQKLAVFVTVAFFRPKVSLPKQPLPLHPG